jgi:hypothetical protein
MTAIAFSPLTYFEELKAAGVPEPQAKVQADTLNKIVEGELATKSDILLLQKDILALQKDILTLEEKLISKLTIRLGSMIAGSFVATIATLAFLMDWMLKGISFSH